MKNKRLNGLGAAAMYVGLKMALEQIELWEIWDYRTAVWKLGAALSILAVLALCFYRAFRLITVFLVVAFQAIADISRYASVILLGGLGDRMLYVWNWCFGHGVIRSENAFRIAVNTGLICEWILEYLAIALLMYLPLKKIVENFHEKEYAIHKTELLFILTPAAVGMLICLLLRIIIVTMEDGFSKTLYQRYPVLNIVLPAILLLSLLSILQGVKLFQDMVYWNREQSGRIILEKQVESLKEHMEEMERVYSGIRSMKHDMKNTLSVIWQLSAGNQAKDNEELNAYLSELSRNFDKLEVRFQTGNTVVDTLLNMKYHEAVRKMPKFGMDVEHLMFPQELHIRSYDIGVILGNALDNGIEACRRMSEKDAHAEVFIRLSSLQKGNLLILKVENSFDGWIARKGQDEFPVTGKADKNSHGIGLANIKSTAGKYQGAMDFRVEGKVFILSVMMKNEGNLE